MYSKLKSFRPHRNLVGADRRGDFLVAESKHLRLAKEQACFTVFFDRINKIYMIIFTHQSCKSCQKILLARQELPERVDFFELALEPRIEARDIVPGERRLKRADGLQVRLLEGASDCHCLAHGLHLRAETFVCTWEFLEREARHLDDDIIERRLEAGGRHFGDVVLQLVERIAHGEKGGDLRDREARRLRGERGGARDARVHLDDDAPPRLRVYRPLDVRAACRDADRLENSDRVVAHRLVFAVGKCLYRRDGY